MQRTGVIAIYFKATAIMLVVMTINACGGAFKSSIKVQLAQGASNDPTITAVDPAVPKAGNTATLTGSKFPTRTKNLVARVVLADSGTKDSTLNIVDATSATFVIPTDTASEVKTILMMHDGKTLARFDIVPAAVATIDALTFSPAAGSYGGTQSVTITSSQPGVTIYYTIDGSTPTTTSAIYTSAILVTSTQTIKAFATKANYSDSAVASAAYTINGEVQTPVASVSTGTFDNNQSVTLYTATAGAWIFYTVDGTIPSRASPIYTGAILVSSTTTIKAMAVMANYSDSAIMSETYTLTVAAPTVDVASGAYGPAQTLTLSSATTGAEIHYTTNGSTPSCTDSTGTVSVNATMTVKAIACKSNYTNSGVATFSYTINGAVATPTATVTNGSCGAPQALDISSSTMGSDVHFTTGDGTQANPTCASPTGTISLTSSTTVKAIACKANFSDSAVATFSYSVETQNGQFCGGDGTAGAPYRICNLDTLANMTNYLSASYIITRDIDASATATSNSGAGWAPVGSTAAPFTGTLNGQDHFICGLKINMPTTNYVGLFGATSATSTVKNISLTDTGIVGQNFVGSIAGTVSGVIQNVAVQGSVQGIDHVGGILGNLTSATGSMANSNANSIVVSGTTNIGGVAGEVSASAAITTSWSSGTVTGDATTGAKVGGLVGSIGVSTISRSYSSAEVSANNRIGGLVGNVSGLNTELCTIDYSHASGNVTAVGANPAVAGGAGGLVGYGVGCPRVKKSYATGNVTSPHTSSNNYVGGLVGSILPSSSYTTSATNVEDSYATGTVTSASVAGRVGGLIGWSQGEVVLRSYASGAVNAPAAMAGGLCGNCRQIHNSFSTGVVSGTAGMANGTTGPYRAGFVGLKYSTVYNAFWLKPAGSPLSCYGYNDWDPANPTPCSQVSDQSFFSTAGGTLFSQWDFTADTGVWYLPGSGALPRLRE